MRNEHHYGISIGINHYTGFRSLNAAVNDAIDFYNWLIDTDGGNLKEENAELIITPDTLGPNPTTDQAKPKKEEINKILRKFKDKCFDHIEENPQDWPQTRLYVFLSGHGIAPKPNEAALLMSNAEISTKGHNFATQQYIEWFEKSQVFKELIFFADCCRSLAEGAALHAPPWTSYQRFNGSEVLILRGYATTYGDKAFEQDSTVDPNNMRGYFTKALMEGLKEGHASNPLTNEIDSIMLSKYIRNRVMELTASSDNNYLQKPYCAAFPTEPSIVLRQNVIPKMINITFVVPDGFEGRVDVLKGNQSVGTKNISDIYCEIPLTFGSTTPVF